MLLTTFAIIALQAAPAPAAEEPVDPYEMKDSNAGARQFAGTGMLEAFNGQDGIRRIVDRLVDTSIDDPVIGEIFEGQDMVRLRRTLFEQFCYILNGGCSYTGRDMKTAHKDLGIQHADMNRLVEKLQAAMTAEGVSFAAQNRFLAKLAPMKRDVVER
jgi:hemoglobin